METSQPKRGQGTPFDGWFTDDDEGRELVKSEMIDKIIKNYTLHAHWLEDSTKQVEITFSSKDLTCEEIRGAIRQYTDAEFIVTLIENTNTEETRTIVMFIDTESAIEFVEKANSSSETKTGIKEVRLFFQPNASLLSSCNLMDLLFYLI